MELISINKELNKIANDLDRALQTELGSEGLGSSNLAKNIKFNVKDGSITINLPHYADDVDRGRKKGTMPPVDAITAWALPKGLDPWAVSISIKKWGVEAQPFLHAITDMYDEIGNRIADAGVEDVTKPIDAEYIKSDAVVK